MYNRTQRFFVNCFNIYIFWYIHVYNIGIYMLNFGIYRLVYMYILVYIGIYVYTYYIYTYICSIYTYIIMYWYIHIQIGIYVYNIKCIYMYIPLYIPKFNYNSKQFTNKPLTSIKNIYKKVTYI